MARPLHAAREVLRPLSSQLHLGGDGGGVAVGRLFWGTYADKIGDVLTVQICSATAGVLIALAST
ncbi:TPA: hypothetical protein EYP44_01380, partial [Candidatus Bathyarchaeota archaeon]|nr:hypothetical protein [Candidatus Bathyarchaeota archaeon]